MAVRAEYCTYFDHRYLTRGLALYASMRQHCQPFRLWVLCLTEECHAALTSLALPDVVVLRFEELERHDAALLEAKSNRSPIEYYLSCTAPLMTWLLDTRPEIEVLTYLDADLFFFSNPDFLFKEFEGFSTLITPHRYSEYNLRNRFNRERGTYNVGWVTFRRDADGMACLRWWRRSCVEWCYDRVENGKWLDQGYLDQFSEKFARVQIVQHPGVNAAPWNLDRLTLSADPSGAPLVDGLPVVFFHFSGLRRITWYVWRTSHRHYRAPLDRQVRRLLYAPYFQALAAADRMLAQRNASVAASPLGYKSTPKASPHPIRNLREVARLLVRGGGVWMVANRVL